MLRWIFGQISTRGYVTWPNYMLALGQGGVATFFVFWKFVAREFRLPVTQLIDYYNFENEIKDD